MLTTNKVEKWIDAAAKLAHYKKLENDLRKQIADDLLEGKPTGTHHFFKFGYDIKIVKKNNTTIDTVVLSALQDDFSPEEKAAIKYKPELVAKNYKALEDHELIDHCLIVKPGLPSMEIQREEEEE